MILYCIEKKSFVLGKNVIIRDYGYISCRLFRDYQILPGMHCFTMFSTWI